MENKTPRPVFILSGMSGTGKSCFIEDARLMGARCLRTFNKFLLNIRFGYDKNAYDFLTMDSFMQAYHIQDYERDSFDTHVLVAERSIIDPYFYLTEVNGYKQSEDEIKDMNHIIELYFNLLTNNGSRVLHVVSFNNLDDNWISKSISEEWTRSQVFKSVEDYREMQIRYRSWFFNKLVELKIPHVKHDIIIHDVSKEFTPDMRRQFIRDVVINS